MAFTGSCIIWLNPEASLWVVVSEEDFIWAQQWRWHATPNQSGSKHYATRVTTVSRKPKRKQIKIYLHKEILKRMGVKRRTKKHIMGDHRNGNSLDCQRGNLRYATCSMNNRNRRKTEYIDEEIPF